MPYTRNRQVLNKSFDGDNLSKASARPRRGSNNSIGKGQSGPSSPLKFLASEELTPSPCKICKKDVGDVKAIKCDRCTSWVHLGCSGLTKSEYEFLERTQSNNFKWICSPCNEDSKVGSSEPCDRIAEQGVKIDTLNSVIITMQKQIQMVIEMLTNEGRLEKKIKLQVSEILENQSEKEEKKNNLVMFNIPETDTDDEEKSAEEDLKKVKSVLHFVNPEVEVTSLVKAQVIRCGKKRNGPGVKPRTIKVLFSDSSSKGKFLRNAKKLRDHKTFSRVGLSYDKTKSELERDRLVKEEFLERKNKGEDVVRYRGQVVLRSELEDQNQRGAVGGVSPTQESQA